MSNDIRNIQYGTAKLQDFRIDGRDDNGNVTSIVIDDKHKVRPTKRFWTSLCVNYAPQGLSTKLFNLFSHDEVFTRITDRLGTDGKDRLRFAIEGAPGQDGGNLLAVTNPSKALCQYESIMGTMEKYQVLSQEYAGGIVRSTHAPEHMDDFSISGDNFSHRYVMETPIDGYGKPLIYLSLLRQVCSNGMIGYAKAFKSEVSLGTGEDNPIFTLERALDSFSNEEGYAALRQRFESATQSWASISECMKVYGTIEKMCQRAMFKKPGTEGLIASLNNRRLASMGNTISPNEEGGQNASTLTSDANIEIARAFIQMTGDAAVIYQLTHVDALSKKKQAQLSSRCTMYDLLNFTTELSTHWCNEANGRLLQAEVGSFVSNEFDLEGTKEARPNFQDWFTSAEDA